eukprot:9500009-Pyramimonas_sp.AAC.1
MASSVAILAQALCGPRVLVRFLEPQRAQHGPLVAALACRGGRAPPPPQPTNSHLRGRGARVPAGEPAVAGPSASRADRGRGACASCRVHP